MTSYALNPVLDAVTLRALYAANGRLQIRDFLAPGCADALLAELEASEAWKLAVARGDQVVNFSKAALAEFDAEKIDKLDRAVVLGGRYGFQFRYDTIRLPVDPGAEPTLLSRLADFLSSPEMVAFMRTVTGADDIDFADAHASRYTSGHFLTAHDDAVETMGRRAAYVLNLTREWVVDWGLLLFYDGQGNVERGYTPGFNTLNLFAVPQPHSVTWVNPLAGAPRYAVTGWLRSRATQAR